MVCARYSAHTPLEWHHEYVLFHMCVPSGWESDRHMVNFVYLFWTSWMLATEFRIKICQYSVNVFPNWHTQQQNTKKRKKNWTNSDDHVPMQLNFSNGFITFRFVSLTFYLLSIYSEEFKYRPERLKKKTTEWKLKIRWRKIKGRDFSQSVQSTWKLLSKWFRRILIFVSTQQWWRKKKKEREIEIEALRRWKFQFNHDKTLWQKSCGDKTNNKALFLSLSLCVALYTTYAFFVPLAVLEFLDILTIKCNQNLNI